MTSFVYQINKEEKEDSIELKIFEVDSKQKTKLSKIKIPYTIYTKKSDFESLKIESEKIEISKEEIKDINKQQVIRLNIFSSQLYEYILNLLKENEMLICEADLPYEHRYLIDTNKQLLTGKKDVVELKYLSLDIETIGSIKEQEIILISTFSPQDKSMSKVYVDTSKIKKDKLNDVLNHKYKDFELVSFRTEKELLERFREDIISFEPQLIIGWNVINFDFKIIKQRFEKYSIPFELSKYKGENKLRILSDFFKNSTLHCPGVLIWDIIDVLKMNFITFDDYKLNTVAKSVLDDEKINLEDEGEADHGITLKIKAIKNMFDKDPVKLIKYNFKDSLLTHKITHKLNLIEMMCKRSILTGTPLTKVKSPIATLDIMYLKELHKRGFVAPSNFNFSDTQSIEGAYVINPEKGFYEDVFVLDFKSLYPSVIMTFNIDPFTYFKEGQIEAPNGARFDNKAGILPELIHQLYKERETAIKEKNFIKSFVLKINMNSFYGAIASPKCRFHNLEIGEAITGFARKIIIKCEELMREKGHKVIYGDTDSIFIKFSKKFKNKEEKFQYGKQIEKEINEYFGIWIKKNFGQKSFLKIEFEKLFSKFFIATKKRYVGFDEITRKTQFIGMEAIRGDWTELAKTFQIHLVDLIFSGKSNSEIEKFISDYVSDLKSGKYNDLLVYSKKIAKPLNQYTKTTPPHVKAARELKEFDGRLVKYIMTIDGPKHINLIDSSTQYDYNHYIEKQLDGVSDDLLNAIGIDFKKIIYSKKQTALDSFF